MILHAVALTVGTLLAVQASVNLQLNKGLRSPFAAAAVQLAAAWVALLVVTLASGAAAALADADRVPGWVLLAGLASPIYITSGILLVPRLGAVATVGLWVAGQMLASAVLDVTGAFGVPAKPGGAELIAGVALVLVGILVVISGDPSRPVPGNGSTARAWRAPGWLLLGMAAGALLPIQGAINALLREEIGAAAPVALISFTVAVVVALLVLAVLLCARATPWPDLPGLRRVPWWGWVGGLCAALYVTSTFLLIPDIGAAATVSLTVAGQQLGSALIDHWGLLGLPRRRVTTLRAAGIAMLLAGSLAVQL
ncbi:DMT family transporter [Lysobacter korlensis]|uniref:DMT family transporter n=1 Tax=Lysobacter korlensis TaxID=553636 RepID=A0ABV6RWB4_9GAMM